MRWHLLGLACAMLVPLLTFALVEARDVAAARRAEAVAQLETLALLNAQGVQQGLSAMRTTAQVLALSPGLTRRDFAAFRLAADEIARDRSVDVVLRNRAGSQVVATRVAPDAPPPMLPPEDPEARAAIDTGRSYVSDVFTSGMSHPFEVRVVVPAVVGGEAGWAVEVAFAAEQVVAWLDRAATPSDWEVTVVGRNGQIIARNHNHGDYVGRGTSRDVLGAITGLTGLWRGMTLGGSTVAGVYLRLPGADWIVTTGVMEAVLGETLERLVLRLAAVAAGLVGLGLFGTIVLGRRIERDTAALARAAETLADGTGRVGPLLPIREFQSVSRALGAAGREIEVRTRTERALLEQVRQSRDLLRAVMDGSADPIFARDLQGRVVLINTAGADMLGLSGVQAALGRNVADLLPPHAAAALLHWDGALAPGGTPVSTSDRFIDETSDCARLFQVSKSPWQDTDGRVAGVVCVARDITERTAAEARLRALQEDLARAGRLSAVAAMAAGLAHELNQPLSAATNFLAAAGSLAGDPRALDLAREAMGEAAMQMHRAADIVRRLRSFIDQDDMAMTEEPLAALVKEAAQAAWQFAADPAARLALVLDPAATALIDVVQVQQVVANLVRNAAEALQTGSADPVCTVSLLRTAEGGSQIDVADTGPGVEPAQRERLFDVFERSGKTGGMGVGLAICRTIVAAHGGRIWAEGNPQGGAVFRFTLPAVAKGADLDA